METQNVTDSSIRGTPPHPYYPLGVAIPEYTTNDLSTQQILAIFTSACIAVLTPTLCLARHKRPDLSSAELTTVLWFVLCGSIHSCLEGYFAFNAYTIASQETVLAQLWKEYSYSDSRYLTADTFVVCMEAITAVFWSPLSFLCAWFIVSDHPLRHPFQSIVSLGQLYGDVLYYAPCTYEFVSCGTEYSRPELEYFVGYYVFLNAFWIVIPFALLISSTKEIGRAFAAAQNRGNGAAK
ncbi:3-beta-hydroxysteroid-Delta(8),Delta(7)-isomerase [Xylariaceae sp. FL1019]|nr:3-beta-hydroxysteroid-Delta(8),Delta(7)-isomerase [Xylariaceae sp. FL1019]